MSTNPLKIGILETGRPPAILDAQFSDYPTMTARWLAPLQAEFQIYSVLDGVLPLDPMACDLWVITGSKFGVYEPHPWIAPVEEFIRSVRSAGRKMIGICFGHQLIAQALGGIVRKSTKGWFLGVQDYGTSYWPDALGFKPERLTLQAYHQDQVDVIPADAKVIASSDFCPVGGLWIPGFAITFQGHPEFKNEYASALLNCRKGTVLSAVEVEKAQTTMDRAPNSGELAVGIAAHLDAI
ncbi:MAG: type 1 glutamine amidotransferase [Pseudoruegeria sp.]